MTDTALLQEVMKRQLVGMIVCGECHVIRHAYGDKPLCRKCMNRHYLAQAGKGPKQRRRFYAGESFGRLCLQCKMPIDKLSTTFCSMACKTERRAQEFREGVGISLEEIFQFLPYLTANQQLIMKARLEGSTLVSIAEKTHRSRQAIQQVERSVIGRIAMLKHLRDTKLTPTPETVPEA